MEHHFEGDGQAEAFKKREDRPHATWRSGSVAMSGDHFGNTPISIYKCELTG